MKILLLTTIYPEPESYKVPEDTKAIHYFAREFVKHGHEVVVCHLYSNPISRIGQMVFKHGLIKENTIDGVRVLFSSLQVFIPHNYHGSRAAQVWNAKRMKKRLIDIGFLPDIIFAHYPTTFLDYCEEIIKTGKASCVLHNTDMVELEKRRLHDDNSYANRIKRLFQIIGFRSQMLLERGKVVGITDGCSPVILSGISNNLLYSEENILRKNNCTKQINSLLFVGRLNDQKRANVVIKALKRCKAQCVLNIIGEGPQKKDLINLSNELQLTDRVHFLGTMSREDVSRKMYENDVFVMVSKGETLGLVYLEAMAAGCITIGSKGEGIDGIIKDSTNGFLVEPDNEEELANCIEYVVNAPKETLASLRINGYRTAASLTDESLADKYLQTLMC